MDKVPYTHKPKLVTSSFPSIKREFNFILEKDKESDQITKAAFGTVIENINVVDVYDTNDGKVSISIRVTIQPYHKTLTSEEINDVCDNLVKRVISNSCAKERYNN